MMFISSIILCLTFTLVAPAQQSNRVNYEQLGISFLVPNGWQSQEIDNGVLLQNQSLEGIILISTHNQSISQIKAEALKPIQDEQGTYLTLIGSLEDLSATAVAGTFDGYLQGAMAKAYIIGIENPYKGLGVTISIAANTERFSDKLKNAGMELYRSFEFKEVDRSQELKEWKTFLAGYRLTFMSSYYSPSSTEGGISGGMSQKRVIDLCPQGFFTMNNSSSIQLDGLGMNNDKGKGNGSWEIGMGEDGSPALILKSYTGETWFYRLAYSENKLYLNGEHYFRTNSGENSPGCH